MTIDEWKSMGAELFGPDTNNWRFVCPSCHHVASVADWKNAGAPEGAIGFSCVGRWAGAVKGATFNGNGGPCDYAGGGLIGLNPVELESGDGHKQRVFQFAVPEVAMP
jgi:hypothetical protein